MLHVQLERTDYSSGRTLECTARAGFATGLLDSPAPVSMMMRAVDLHLLVPLAIFAFTYFVIAVGNFPGLQLDRTGAALAGAVLMVITGSLGEAQALAAIDFHTLLLLLGMMIIVANLRISGAFA